MEKLLETAGGILVLVVALLPGAVADLFYRRISGINWREPLYRTALRWLALSIAGLTVYVVLAENLPLPPPLYIFPSTYTSPALNTDLLPWLLLPLVGNVIAALCSAILLGGLLRALDALWPEAPYGAWNVFVGRHVPYHWVVVGLEDGSVYTGKLRYADTSVITADRDLILEEPARFEPETKEYRPTGLQHLFLPGRVVYSVATVYDPNRDERISAATKPLYQPENSK